MMRAIGATTLFCGLLVLSAYAQDESAESVFAEQQSCEGKEVGAKCWMETNRERCRVWNSDLSLKETAEWSGRCFEGHAHGSGLLTWHWANGSSTHIGTLVRGKKHRSWIELEPEGRYSGEYSQGRRKGKWEWCDTKGRGHIDEYEDGRLKDTYEIRNCSSSKD